MTFFVLSKGIIRSTMSSTSVVFCFYRRSFTFKSTLLMMFSKKCFVWWVQKTHAFYHLLCTTIWTLPGIGLLADEWDSLVWQRWGCFLDMCRCRLLVPPLSCNVLKQMRQRTAAKSSNRSKWLQIQLCLRPTAWSSTFWWSPAETSWAAPWMPVTADIVSATFTKETLSESPSSIGTLKKSVWERV